MIALLLALSALQTQPNPTDPGRFADFDLNEDGSIERDEVRARFDFEASAEATYQASRQSAKASAPRPAVTAPRTDWAAADAWFAAADKDGDGKLTQAELNTQLAVSPR
ncbi:MAG: hypothetical protein KYX69_18150 [Sphingomonas sp.]|uniref:hypothetical protein n=1 Tax=Sphingomonas sp. TaxID=28214 RepID=UPI0026290F9B|nr:hypothetical protein [Sphingomonas sp.]MDK2769630.1 hypothetical protein [Sphingomonas sp.]